MRGQVVMLCNEKENKVLLLLCTFRYVCIELTLSLSSLFSSGVYPHALGPMTPWLGLSDRAKVWKPYSCQDKERERGKDRERTRDREPKKEQERERDQENTPAFQSRSR